MRYGTRLLVDLAKLADNFEELRLLAPSNEILFMIKANAYGHGLCEIAHFASEELGAASFGVASLGEAVVLRKKLPSMTSEIFVFSDTNLDEKETRELYLDYNIVPVVSSMEDLENFLEDKSFGSLPLTLKLDTGMHRLGIETDRLEEAAKLIKRAGRKSVKHLMTHFSSSFIKLKEGDKTSRQYELFLQAKKTLSSLGIEIEETSCANSGAIEQGFALEESHIRPGLMLYGPASATKDGKPLYWRGGDISSLETRIIKSFHVKKGTPVGYGGHVCHQDGLLVYAPLGYGDGFLTYYSKRDFSIEGHRARVLGRVNMDMAALLFPSGAKGLERGKPLKIWESGAQRVLEMASSAQTTPYQILTAAGERIPRSYRF